MASQLTPLLSSPTRYLQSDVAYLDHTDRAEKVCQLCSTEIPKIVIAAATEDLDRICYLGVGSGSGEADIKLLIQLTKRYPKISATIIEPTPSMVTDFKENIIKEGSALKDVEFEWKNMTFEEYMESEYNNQCFHCVLLVCVTAYFVDMEQTMKDLYKMLSKTGSLVIINNSEKGVFDAIRQQFPRLCSHFGRKNAPTDKVVTVLNELGASVRVLNMEAVVDITPCLQKDSEIGNLILDIFTHVLNFRETAPEDLVESVLQFLQGPKLLSHRIDKNVYIHNNKDVIIVQSP